MLPAYADRPGADLGLRRHVAGCEDCKEELTRYEVLTKSLASLSDETVPAPAGLLRSLQSIPEQTSRVDELRSHVARNRSKYLSGAAVLVAGAAGAALWRSRRRLATA